MNGAQGIDRRGFLRLLWPARREPPAPGSDDAETPRIPDASSDIASVAMRAAGDQATAAALARRALGPMALPAEAPTSLHLRWLAAAAPEPPARPHAELDPGRCLAHHGSFCTACAERCLVPGAIVLTLGRPRVIAARCTGCGTCADVCPAPAPAIVIRSIS
jgi:hypothetical protein